MLIRKTIGHSLRTIRETLLLQTLREHWGEKYLHIFKYWAIGFKIHFAVFLGAFLSNFYIHCDI